VCQSRESRRASESGRLVPACHIIGQRMCGSLASECRSRNGATNKTRTCKTTPVSTISVRGPFVARWCGSVEQICTRRQCQQKCQQQCRASLIELSLLVALSQPRIKLRRVAGQCTASLVKARSGQVDASPLGAGCGVSVSIPGLVVVGVPFRVDARRPQSTSLRRTRACLPWGYPSTPRKGKRGSAWRWWL